ncbi:MAG TPA: Asp-tRNA(Asn)/Glu-tRNA(Gln) amidotransferase GatCAB subunit B, partial [Blastocatellia bacterium]|nr:Asp-tRNA(Asn)/Glu-tRNA(Gln) amidotransferase GatCAB subunit B [Blastocatellia bacterium]
AHDYRYFPEPVLPPLTIPEARVEEFRARLPELPEPRRRRFLEEYGLSFDEAAQLTDSRQTADYYEAAARASGNAKAASNWILNELAHELKNSGDDIGRSPVSPESLGEMVRLIDAGDISGKMAKDVLVEMYRTGRGAREVVKEKGGGQVSDEGEIRALVGQAIAANPKQVESYRAGKTGLFGFFVGQVMKLSGGRANPQLVNDLLKQYLEEQGGNES